MFSDEDYEGFAFVKDVTCNMNDKAGIPDSWILLDSQLTVDIFKNNKLLKTSMKQKVPVTTFQCWYSYSGQDRRPTRIRDSMVL